MIETYSSNITVPSGSSIPLNTVFRKGTTVTKTGDASIQLNKCGIYELVVNASGIATTGGDIKLQLMINGTMVQNAFASETATDTTSTHSLSFTTKIQVPTSYNENCACSEAFIASLINVGVETNYSLVNAVITKIV